MKRKISVFMLSSILSLLLIGCDLFNNNQTTVTTELESATTTTTIWSNIFVTTQYDPYRHQDYLDLLSVMTGESNSEVLEEVGAMIFSISGFDTEEEVYKLLVSLEDSFTELIEIESLADLQEWWNNFKLAGFNESYVSETMVAVLINLYDYTASQFDTASYTSRIDEINAENVLLQEDITSLLEDKSNFENNFSTYISQLPSHNTEAQTYYNALYDYDHLITDYYDRIDEIYFTYDYILDYSLLNSLQNLLKSYYETNEPQKLTDYQTELSYVDGTEGFYTDVMDIYDDYLIAKYVTIPDCISALSGIIDGDGQYVITEIESKHNQYENIIWNLLIKESEVFDNNNAIVMIEQEIKDIQLYGFFSDYISEPSSQAKFVMLIATIYGELDGLLSNVSEDTVNFIFSMLTEQMETNEETMLQAFESYLEIAMILNNAISEEEFNNMKDISYDVASILIGFYIDDPVEEVALKDLLESQIDYLFSTSREINNNVLSFLDSLTYVEKVQIYALIASASDYSVSEEELVIQACVLIDSILVDSELDMDAILDFIVYFYWVDTLNVEFGTVNVTQIQENAAAAFDDFLLLVSEVATFDSSNLTEAQITTIQSLETAMNDIISAVTTNPNNLPA
ncbi:MAG: hypothetical protein AB7U79_06485 [Candidatus Izemoplasmatales bacterium]